MLPNEIVLEIADNLEDWDDLIAFRHTDRTTLRLTDKLIRRKCSVMPISWTSCRDIRNGFHFSEALQDLLSSCKRIAPASTNSWSHQSVPEIDGMVLTRNIWNAVVKMFQQLSANGAVSSFHKANLETQHKYAECQFFIENVTTYRTFFKYCNEMLLSRLYRHPNVTSTRVIDIVLRTLFMIANNDQLAAVADEGSAPIDAQLPLPWLPDSLPWLPNWMPEDHGVLEGYVVSWLQPFFVDVIAHLEHFEESKSPENSPGKLESLFTKQFLQTWEERNEMMEWFIFLMQRAMEEFADDIDYVYPCARHYTI